PGATIDIEALGSPRNLQWQLTQKRVVDAKDIITPWNPRSADTPRILEVMMFHQAAGGDQYTGLTQRYDAALDLSDHLATGRAILLGRAETKALALEGDALRDAQQDQSWTFVRVLIPVTPPPSQP